MITPNMNLVVSTVDVDSGLQWENNLNADLDIIDAHDHSAGNGVPIGSSGININNDLPLNGNNLTLARSLRMQAQTSALALADDLGCLYVSGVDLYYNDESGNQIRITSGGTVNATSSGISSGSATASFVSSVLVVNSASNTPANIQGGSLLLGNNVAASKFLTLSPPSAMAVNYSLTLPALPVSQKFMTLDASGNMAAPWAVDSVTLAISSNVISVVTIPDLSVTTAKIVDANVTTAKIADLNVTNAKLAASSVTSSKISNGNVTQAKKEIRTTGTSVAAGGIAVSASCAGFAATASTTYVDVTNLSVTITTLGNPVWVGLVPDGSTNPSLFQSIGESNVTIQRNFADVGFYDGGNSGGNTVLPATVIYAFDVIAAGTYTYVVRIKSVSGGANNARIQWAKLVAYEL